MRQSPPRELRPNCLLTRYPICFFHGLKSIFNFADYWHGIPEFLAAHGYETFEFTANWRGPNEVRLKQYADQLERTLIKHDKVHVIGHSLATLNILELINWAQFENRLASVTLISPPFGGSPWALLGNMGKFGARDFFSNTNQTLQPQSATNIVTRFKKPPGLLMGSVISNPKYMPCPNVAIQHGLLSHYLKSKGRPIENDGLVPLESQRVALQHTKLFWEFPGDHMQVIGASPWPKTEKTAHERFLDHSIFLAENDLSATQ